MNRRRGGTYAKWKHKQEMDIHRKRHPQESGALKERQTKESDTRANGTLKERQTEEIDTRPTDTLKRAGHSRGRQTQEGKQGIRAGSICKRRVLHAQKEHGKGIHKHPRGLGHIQETDTYTREGYIREPRPEESDIHKQSRRSRERHLQDIEIFKSAAH